MIIHSLTLNPEKMIRQHEVELEILIQIVFSLYPTPLVGGILESPCLSKKFCQNNLGTQCMDFSENLNIHCISSYR